MSNSFFEYRKVTKAHIASLQATLDKARLQLDQAHVAVEMAERKERQVTAEKEIWKHRALEAEAALQSRGDDIRLTSGLCSTVNRSKP